jgi:hypothetical protein
MLMFCAIHENAQNNPENQAVVHALNVHNTISSQAKKKNCLKFGPWGGVFTNTPDCQQMKKDYDDSDKEFDKQWRFYENSPEHQAYSKLENYIYICEIRIPQLLEEEETFKKILQRKSEILRKELQELEKELQELPEYSEKEIQELTQRKQEISELYGLSQISEK